MRRLTWRFCWAALLMLTISRLYLMAWQWPRISVVEGVWPSWWVATF